MDLETTNHNSVDQKTSNSNSTETAPRFRLVSDPNQAIQLFDTLDDEAVASFIFPDKGLVIPPIPEEFEIYDYLMQNALILIDGGELALARTVLSDVVAYDTTNANAIRWMGWCFWQEGNLAEAETWYRKLVAVRVSEEDQFELGDILYQRQNFQDAQIAWMEALKICGVENPLLFDIYKNLGNVATIVGDFDSAEEQYNKALTLRPKSDVLQVNLGTLMLQQQETMPALRHFKNAVEINPHNDRAWCGIAMSAHALNDFDFASEAIDNALSINPENAVGLQLKSEESKWKSK